MAALRVSREPRGPDHQHSSRIVESPAALNTNTNTEKDNVIRGPVCQGVYEHEGMRA